LDFAEAESLHPELLVEEEKYILAAPREVLGIVRHPNVLLALADRIGWDELDVLAGDESD